MDNENKGGSNAVGIFLVIWFIVGLILIFICSKINGAFTAMAFGLMSGGIGIAVCAMKNNKSPLFGAAFATMGLLSLLGGIFVQWGYYFIGQEKYDEAIVWLGEKGAPMGMCLLMAFIGAGVFAGGVVGPILKKNRCTTEVKAMCVELKTSRGKRGRTLYSPVFTYYYDGTDFRAESNTYSNMDVPNLNEEYTLYINPNKPYEYYRRSIQMMIFMALFGIGFMAGGLLGFVLQF